LKDGQCRDCWWWECGDGRRGYALFGCCQNKEQRWLHPTQHIRAAEESCDEQEDYDEYWARMEEE
jgi:hypothetical protein